MSEELGIKLNLNEQTQEEEQVKLERPIKPNKLTDRLSDRGIERVVNGDDYPTETVYKFMDFVKVAKEKAGNLNIPSLAFQGKSKPSKIKNAVSRLYFSRIGTKIDVMLTDVIQSRGVSEYGKDYICYEGVFDQSIYRAILIVYNAFKAQYDENMDLSGYKRMLQDANSSFSVAGIKDPNKLLTAPARIFVTPSARTVIPRKQNCKEHAKSFIKTPFKYDIDDQMTAGKVSVAKQGSITYPIAKSGVELTIITYVSTFEAGNQGKEQRLGFIVDKLIASPPPPDKEVITIGGKQITVYRDTDSEESLSDQESEDPEVEPELVRPVRRTPLAQSQAQSSSNRRQPNKPSARQPKKPGFKITTSDDEGDGEFI